MKPIKTILPPHRYKTRLNVISAILLLATVGLVARLIWLQVTTSDILIERGYKRSLRIQTEDALRGLIIDREGEALAISTPVSTIIADPKRMWQSFDETYNELKQKCSENSNIDEDCIYIFDKNRDLFQYQFDKIKSLAEILGENPKDLYELLERKKNSNYTYLARQIPPTVADEAIALKLPYIWQEDSYKRYYPAGEVVSYLIGYTNIDDKGQEGLEKLYDKRLEGQMGKTKVLQDPKGYTLRVIEEVTPTASGATLQLSIDKRIQYTVHQAISEVMDEFKATSVSAVMIDVKTGEILAMATVPSGNPNNNSERRAEFIKNRTVTDIFEPGSTMKPLAVAAALEAGVIKPHTVFKKGGRYKMGRNTVVDTHNYGTQDVNGIIQKSSNVGMAMISEKIPREKHYQMMKALGFGHKSNVDFPGERSGILHDSKKLSPFEFATTTYGYTISVTALQLAHAYATLANDGLSLPLTLLKRNFQPEGVQVMSKKTAHQVQQMLEEVVAEKGTGKRANTESYTVAGKTGTSHKSKGDKGYAEKNYLGLFAGYAPAKNPRIAMVIVVDDPHGAHYGGLVAAPAFSKITERALKILGVLPDKVSKETDLILKDEFEEVNDNQKKQAPKKSNHGKKTHET